MGGCEHCGVSSVTYYLPTQSQHMHQRRPSCNPSNHLNNGRSTLAYGSPLTQCFWTFFWLALLLLISYPVGLVAAQLYLIVSPILEVSGNPRWAQQGVAEPLLKAMHLPLICARNMTTAKPLIFI